MIALGKLHGLGDGSLAGVDRALEVAAFDGKLNADVAGIVFAVDEGSPGAFLDGGEFGERDLLPGRSGDEQIADVAGAGAVLGLHADNEVEKFFTLDDLSGSLSADGRLHNSFDVGDVDAVAGNFGAVGVDDEAGLAELANNGELLEAGSLIENVANFDGLFLEDIEIRTENFDGEGGLESRESLIDGVFRGLGKVEDDAGVGREFFIEVAR